MQYCSCFSRILLSGTYLSRYFDENGNEDVEKNEVSLYIFVFNEAFFFLVTCLCSRDNLLEFCLSEIDTSYNMLVINVKQRHLDNKSIYFNWKVFFSKLFLKKINITHYYSFKILLCF